MDRKSVQLQLSFPYDWSNPGIRDDTLIISVLKRGIYTDICRVCAYFGIDAVERLACILRESVVNDVSLERMLRNIKKGFARAENH